MSRKNLPTDVLKLYNLHGGDTSVCWEWKGKVNKRDGRPYITIDGKRTPAYRVVLTLFKGEPPIPKALACHSCDDKLCGNYTHLRWDTHQANMDDMVERDRHGLPATVIRAIRRLLQEGKTHIEISKLYGVSRETVTAINNNRSPKYTKDTDE